jgi:hypothetical protein
MALSEIYKFSHILAPRREQPHAWVPKESYRQRIREFDSRYLLRGVLPLVAAAALVWWRIIGARQAGRPRNFDSGDRGDARQGKG